MAANSELGPDMAYMGPGVIHTIRELIVRAGAQRGDAAVRYGDGHAAVRNADLQITP